MPERWNEPLNQPAGAPVRLAGRLGRWARRHKARTALLATGAAGFVLLYGLEVAAERGGHSIDPTDAMNYDSYALRNDTAITRFVHLCDDPACSQLEHHFEWISVWPGTAAEEQVYWGPGESAVYAVATATDGPRQCLVLNASVKTSATVDAPLSSAGHCGS